MDRYFIVIRSASPCHAKPRDAKHANIHLGNSRRAANTDPYIIETATLLRPPIVPNIQRTEEGEKNP